MLTALRGFGRIVPVLFLLVATAQAQSPNVGQVAERDCSARDIHAAGGELYSIKVDGTLYDDWLFDLSAKSGDRIGVAPDDVSGDVWQVLSGNFTRPESGSNVVTTILTFPGGEVYVDNGDLSAGFNFTGLARVQVVGDSSDLPGNAGIAVARGRGNRYTADLGMGPVAFPIGTTAGGILLALAPVVEINDLDDGGCSWGGVAPDPSTGHGLFIGFNIFRMEDDGSMPDVANVTAPENFVYFADIFDAPGEDLSTYHDPDGIPYSGDEVIVFADFDREPSGALRTVGTAPELGRSYWYAYQPVVQGDPADFAAISLGKRPTDDYTVDLTGNGVADAVDVDPSFGSGLEFYSPQANHGIGGLGLTNGGACLSSELLWATLDPNDPNGPGILPAAGDATLEATRQGDEVLLRITTGLEEAELLGFIAYRLEGSRRVRLNAELIVARGGTGTEYELVDDQAARRSRGSVSYLVEVLTRDGAVDELLGPVRVKGGVRASSRRR